MPVGFESSVTSSYSDRSNKKQLQRLARNTSEKKRKDKIKLGIKKISSLLPESYKDPKDVSIKIIGVYSSQTVHFTFVIFQVGS